MTRSLKFYKKNIFVNLLITLQISTVFILITILVSAINSRLAYYSFFKDSLSQNGICITSSPGGINTEEKAKECFKKATNIYGGKNIDFYNEDEDYCSVLSYTDDVMNKIPPKLESGRYPQLNDDNVIECLVCKGFGFKENDIFTMTDDNDKKYKFKITGILSDNQMLMGNVNMEITYLQDYRDFYSNIDSNLMDSPAFLTTEKCLNKVGLKGGYQTNTMFVVDYPKDAYSNSELADMAYNYNFLFMHTNEEMNKASIQYIYEQLYILLPIIITIFIITIFTVITTNVVMTITNLKNYAILYLCGAKWTNCSLISLSNFSITAIFSIILSVIFFQIGNQTFFKNTVVSSSYLSILVCFIILICFVITSFIVPLIIVKNKQPRDVLKEN